MHCVWRELGRVYKNIQAIVMDHQSRGAQNGPIPHFSWKQSDSGRMAGSML